MSFVPTYGPNVLRPLAIGVIGALCISLVLSLLATPLFYYLFLRVFRMHERPLRGVSVLME